MPHTQLPIQALQEDMVRGDKINAIAAYSPFSDGIAESLQQAGTNFVDDFEAVLHSEPNMTDETMKQLLEVVGGRLLKGHSEGDTDSTRDDLCLLLARLRVFKPNHFDRLMTSWITPVLASSEDSACPLILALVGVSCLSMNSIHDSFQRLQRQDTGSGPGMCCNNIASLLSISDGSDYFDMKPAAYRFHMEWSRFFLSHPVDALTVLSAIAPDPTTLGLRSTPQKNDLVPSLLSDTALPQTLSSMKPGTLEVLDDALSSLFRASARESASKVQTLIDTCDSFSLPFCRLYLQIVVAHAGEDQQQVKDSIVDALLSLAVAGSNEDIGSQARWVPLVASVGADIARRVREKAEHAFFSLGIPLVQGRPGASPLFGQPEDIITEAAKYVDVVAKTAYTISDTADAIICAQLNDKLAQVWRALNVQHPAPGTPLPGLHLNLPQTPTAAAPLSDTQSLCTYLPLVLRLTCLHRRSSSNNEGATPINKQSQQNQVKLCVLLVSIALHPGLTGQTELTSHILDVVATLVDGLTDDVRAWCARGLRDKMKDSRIAFLFGNMNTLTTLEGAGHVLQLVKEGKGVIGDWKPKQWEILESNGTETSLNLGLFQARAGNRKGAQELKL